MTEQITAQKTLRQLAEEARQNTEQEIKINQDRTEHNRIQTSYEKTLKALKEIGFSWLIETYNDDGSIQLDHDLTFLGGQKSGRYYLRLMGHCARCGALIPSIPIYTLVDLGYQLVVFIPEDHDCAPAEEKAVKEPTNLCNSREIAEMIRDGFNAIDDRTGSTYAISQFLGAIARMLYADIESRGNL